MWNAIDRLTSLLDKGNWSAVLALVAAVVIWKIKDVVATFDWFGRRKLDFLQSNIQSEHSDESTRVILQEKWRSHVIQREQGLHIDRFIREAIVRLYHAAAGELDLDSLVRASRYMRIHEGRPQIVFSFADRIHYGMQSAISAVLSLLAIFAWIALMITKHPDAVRVVQMMCVFAALLATSVMLAWMNAPFATAKRLKAKVDAVSRGLCDAPESSRAST